MPASCRNTLVWLLCALLLCAGLPQLQQARCTQEDTAAAGARTPQGCCAPDRCCCPKIPAQNDCGCRGPAREPLPEPPAPRQPLQNAPTPVPPPPGPLPPPDASNDRPARAAGDRVACALLPHRTRQEALSVWRL